MGEKTLLEDLIMILGFNGAIGDYSYIDRLGNAIDEISVIEAIKDAIRAYYTNCSKTSKCIEYDREHKQGVLCPEISSERLNNAISWLISQITNSTRIDVIKLSREIALKSYTALIDIRKNRACPTASGGK